MRARSTAWRSTCPLRLSFLNSWAARAAVSSTFPLKISCTEQRGIGAAGLLPGRQGKTPPASEDPDGVLRAFTSCEIAALELIKPAAPGSFPNHLFIFRSSLAR